jgi:hypothetical protein
MRKRFVAIILFARFDQIDRARIGRPNPWRHINPIHDLFERWQIKSPFSKKELDPLFLIESDFLPEWPLGYAKVFDHQNYGGHWMTEVFEKRNAWGYWDNNLPIGPGAEPERYKGAEQFAKSASLFEVRAFSPRRAAELGLLRFRDGATALITRVRQ